MTIKGALKYCKKKEIQLNFGICGKPVSLGFKNPNPTDKFPKGFIKTLLQINFDRYNGNL
jgi:hypothetical protein